ncbi:MAG: hypothetical protein F6K50_17980 [Moorea sp. SIO3I7]|nr:MULTISPECIES: hypothetical protein [unclassified Moorena]NEN97344.1 hypothetical protein [Moorena sp. SIO3I7]NEO11585.1 hypothetical protein [Moorena sp. SIO3E8]NEP23023.1 hypothetical protein [Moorena sp. SIO3I6]NEP99716.1 hypothetical protein [Moorena sp. SIO3F7]
MSFLGLGDAIAFHRIVWPISLSLRVPPTVGQRNTCDQRVHLIKAV